MNLYAMPLLVACTLLLVPVAGNAQNPAMALPAAESLPAPGPSDIDRGTATGTQPVSSSMSTRPQSSGITPVAPAAELNTRDQSFQASLPAGVCPVITEYLFQQCQQNPADPMCAFAGAY